MEAVAVPQSAPMSVDQRQNHAGGYVFVVSRRGGREHCARWGLGRSPACSMPL